MQTGRRSASLDAIRVAGIYCVLGGLWIVLSDRIAGAGFVETTKGLGFVLASGLLIYLLLRREFQRHHRLEADLAKARDEALESDRMKLSLLANMSHEIRTPLNVLTGYLDLLRDELGPANRTEAEAEFFDGVDKATTRLLDTLSKIIDMARLESGDFEPSPGELHLVDLLEAKIEHYRKLSAKRGLPLEWENEAGQVRVHFDRYALECAVANLLDNAIKFTPHGKVSVRLVSQEGGDVVLQIADTGVGMPKHYLSRVFAPFSQQQSDHTRPYEGSGLGLAITKRFLERNGAWISVETEVGKGTTFSVHFPPAVLAPARAA